MPSFGDYVGYQNHYSNKTTDVVLLAADSALANVISPKTSNHALYIQKITYTPLIVSAQAITLIDDGSGPDLALIPASQALPYVADYGPKGIKLTTGANLDITPASAGPAGMFHIECYEKLANVIAYDSGAANQ